MRLAAIASSAVLLCCSSPALQKPTEPVVETGAEPSRPKVTKPTAAEDKPAAIARATVAIGYFGRCFTERGKLYCWDRETAPPEPLTQMQPLPIAKPVVSLDVSARHACAVTDRGGVWCWGENRSGQLGAGSPEQMSEQPLAVKGIGDALTVSLGNNHSCALRRGGKVSCWGLNRSGECGHSTAYTEDARRLVHPVEVAGLTDAVQIVTGESFSCALKREGIVQCWGRLNDLDEQLRWEARPEPQTIAQLDGTTQLDADGSWGCAVMKKGRVRCWGYNYNKRLGHGEREAGPFVEGIGDAIEVAVGDAHACARLRGGSVSCWGDPRDGRLGRGDPATIAGPSDGALAAEVVGLRGPRELALGQGLSCARDATSLICWGRAPWREGEDAPLPERMAIR